MRDLVSPNKIIKDMKELIVITSVVEEPKLSITFGSNDIKYDSITDTLVCYNNHLAKQVSEAIKHTVDIELRVHNNVIDLNKLIGCSCSIDNIGDNVKKLVIYKMIDKKELRVK